MPAAGRYEPVCSECGYPLGVSGRLGQCPVGGDDRGNPYSPSWQEPAKPIDRKARAASMLPQAGRKGEGGNRAEALQLLRRAIDLGFIDAAFADGLGSCLATRRPEVRGTRNAEVRQRAGDV